MERRRSSFPYMKLVGTDKVSDWRQFLHENLSNFLDEILNYLAKYSHSTRKTLKRRKNVDMNLLLKCVSKLFENFENYEDVENLEKINKIFLYIFHPETVTAMRSVFFNIFRQFFEQLDYKKAFKIFKPSVMLIIPYDFLLTDAEDIANFKNSVPKEVFPIIIIPTEFYDQKNALIMFKQVCSSISSSWSKNPNLYRKLFFNQIFRVIYPSLSTEAGFKPLPFGFNKSPLSPQIIQTIVTFFESFIDFKFDINLLLPKIQHLKLFILFIKQFKDDQILSSQPLLLCNLIRSILSCDLIHSIFNESYSLSMEIFDLMYSKIECHRNDTDIMSSLTELFKLFFVKMIECLPSDRANEEIRMLFQKHITDTIPISTMYISFLTLLLTSSNKINTTIRTFFSEITIETELLSAVASKYSQYLAIKSFPIIYEVNIKELIEYSEMLQKKKQRIQFTNSFDLITDNIEEIINSPEEFTRTKMKLIWEEHSKYNESLEKIIIPPLQCTENEILTNVDKFLNCFINYENINNLDQKRNSFFILASYISHLIEFRNIPFSVQFNHISICKYCFNYLLHGIFEQDDSLIRKISFSLLSKILEFGDLKKYIDSELLFQFYIATGLMLISNDLELVELGFINGNHMLQKGYTGSTMLIPMLINVVEMKKIKLSYPLIGFLSSFPFFRININENKLFIHEINRIIQQSKIDDIIIDYEKVLTNNNKENNNLNRIIKIIEELPHDWDLILPIYSILLADETTQEIMNEQIIEKILDIIVISLKEQSLIPYDESFSMSAICTFESIFCYFEIIIKEFPNLFYGNFLKPLVEYLLTLNSSIDSVFLFYYLININDLFIISHSIIPDFTFYMNYVNYLYEVPNKFKVKEIVDIAMECLRKLSLFYKNYPFPQSILFPMSSHNSIYIGQSCEINSTANDNILTMAIEENDQVDVSNIATSGHYRWNISCITSMISGNEPLNLELKFADGIELKDPTNSEKRIDIENKINQFYGEDYLNGINLPEINVDNNILEQINKIWDYDNKPLKPQTDFKSIENPAAAVVTALGLNDSLCPVGKEKKNLLELKQLVSNTGRNCFKVGVVYVGDNVFEQNDLFQTTYDETTPHFREFLNGLGWPVELVTHKFYNGGLSLSGQKDGKTSIYYADLKTELMFHVGPLLPTNKNDKQQITKKRHIGNDHIHIIWSENPKNYEISTITSQFNQAHIVIYPIDTCLFRVDVFWKPSMKWFGPLRTSLVCTKKTLPSLARSTSISAMTAFYRQRCKFFSMTLNNVYSMKAVRSEIDQYQEDSPINKTMRNLMLCTERGIPLGTEGFSSSSGMLDVKSISIG